MSKKSNKNSKFLSSQTNKITTSPLIKWISLCSLVMVALLIFYPPYFRGLFFNSEVFVTHIITSIVFIVVCIRKILEKDYSFLRTPIDWAFMAYVVAYLLSLTGAVHISDAIYGFYKVLNYFMIYWLVTQVVQNFRDYERILQVLTASGLGVAIIGILCATGIYNYPSGYTDGMILSTLQYPNTTAAYLSVMVLLVVILLNRNTKLFVNIGYVVTGYIMTLVILGTLSKGAWLIFFIGGVLLLLGVSRANKVRTAYNMIVIVLAAVIGFAGFYPALTENNNSQAFLYLFLGLIISVFGIVAWEGLRFLYRKYGNRVIYSSIVIIVLMTVTGTTIIGNNTVTNLPGVISNEIEGLSDFNNSSYTTRYDFTRWGWAIIKDHPLTGAGAGGWNALYHQYQDYLAWTTEAHNHFIQVWVEAGTIGMVAFLSMWLAAIVCVIQIRKKLKTEQKSFVNDNWNLVWGTLSAAIALGLHASFDFDLSLAAVSIVLWVLFALLNSGHKIVIEPGRFNIKNKWINMGLAASLLLVMLIGGGSFAIADSNADKGDYYLKRMEQSSDTDTINSEYTKAKAHYEKAAAIDSYNPYYKAKLSYIYALEWRSLMQSNDNSSKSVHNKAVSLINQAHSLQPYDNDLSNYLVSSITVLGDLKLMLHIAQSAITANPNDINTYNLYAETIWKGIEYYRKINSVEEAGKLAAELISINDLLVKQKQQINEAIGKWQGPPLQLSNNNQVYIAKCHYLLGHYNTAVQIFDSLLAIQENQTSDTYIWYAASLYKSGQNNAATELTRGWQPEHNSIYQSLINTGPLI